jgi:hypothetical protein
MKKFLLGAAILGVAAWLIFSPATDAQRIDGVSVRQIWDSPRGYSTVVCSVWNNDSDPDGGYTTLANKTGYWYHLIQVQENAPGAAQAVTLRFWASATDSTSIYDGALTVDLVSGGSGLHSFPVRCYKVSLTGVDATDDLSVIGYARDH